LALVVPLSRFTSLVGGGSAFFVSRLMLRYILESKTQKITADQAEAKHLVSDSRLGKKPVPFGFQNQRWQVLLSKFQSGDDLWEYDHYVGPLCAEAGIAILRGGEVVDHIVTMRS